MSRGCEVLYIDGESRAASGQFNTRYEFLDAMAPHS